MMSKQVVEIERGEIRFSRIDNGEFQFIVEKNNGVEFSYSILTEDQLLEIRNKIDDVLSKGRHSIV